jgi:lipopolysaccharide/colanic/teichoic acid biosynthesis glycosyltransferase
VDVVVRLLTALGFAFLLEAALFYLHRSLALPLSAMMAGSAAALVVLLIVRAIYYAVRSGGFGGDRILLVGATPLNREIAERIEGSPEFGFTVIGFLEDRLPAGTRLEGAEVLGPLSALPEVRRRLAPHRVIADIPPEELWLGLMDGASAPGSLEKPDALYELLFARVCRLQPANLLFGGEMAPARSRLALQTMCSSLLALAGLLVCAPAIVCIALLIRICHGGPAFERQLTAGWNLRPFTRFRFRCHRIVKSDAGERREWTTAGRWLARLRLPGLPQLWNILRGEMTFVGPPPLRTEFANALIQALPHYRLAFAIQPGLASWSQVNAATNAMTALQYDLYYIKSMSPSLSLSVLRYAFVSARSPRESDAGL